MLKTPSEVQSETISLDQLTTISMGQSPSGDSYNEVGNGVPLVNGPSEFDGQEISKVKWTTQPTKLSQAGDTIVCVRGNTIGRVAYSDGKYCLGRGVAAVRAKQGTADSDFVFQLIQSLQTYFLQIANGSTFPNIDGKTLSETQILRLSLAEQRKVAKILLTWDDALSKLTTLLKLKEKRLAALRAILLFGELQLDQGGRSWVPTRLSTVTHELTVRNAAEDLGRNLVMGVTNKRGIVPMREQTVAGDIARYKHLPPQAFAYNPMRINVGSIAKNEASETVLISPDYVVFGCNPDGIEPDYLDHLRKTPWWAHYINSGGSGSVRQRTYYADLAALRLPLPDIEEQREIVAILNAAKADLSSTEEMIEAVKLQKRGLMQKLLTGEWRVNLKEVI